MPPKRKNRGDDVNTKVKKRKAVCQVRMIFKDAKVFTKTMGRIKDSKDADIWYKVEQKNGLSFNVNDPSGICGSLVNISPAAFSKLEIPHDFFVALKLAHIHSFCKSVNKSNDTFGIQVALYEKEDSLSSVQKLAPDDKITFLRRSPQNVVSKELIPVIDLDQSLFEPEDMDYDANITMCASHFHSIIEYATTISDVIWIQVTDDSEVRFAVDCGSRSKITVIPANSGPCSSDSNNNDNGNEDNDQSDMHWANCDDDSDKPTWDDGEDSDINTYDCDNNGKRKRRKVQKQTKKPELMKTSDPKNVFNKMSSSTVRIKCNRPVISAITSKFLLAFAEWKSLSPYVYISLKENSISSFEFSLQDEKGVKLVHAHTFIAPRIEEDETIDKIKALFDQDEEGEGENNDEEEEDDQEEE